MIGSKQYVHPIPNYQKEGKLNVNELPGTIFNVKRVGGEFICHLNHKNKANFGKNGGPCTGNMASGKNIIVREM